MSQVITPIVGRKVWFRPAPDQLISIHNPAGMSTAGDQPLDATIIAVGDDRMVNLLVIDAIGNSFPVLFATLVQEGDPIPVNGRYAEWMPYQQGQARRDSAIDRAITATTPIGAVSAPVASAQAQSATLDLTSDTPLAPACDLSGDGTCDACQ